MFHIISFKFCSLPQTLPFIKLPARSSITICRLVFSQTQRAHCIALHCIGKESTHQAENCSAPSEQFHSNPALIFPRHGNLPLIKKGECGKGYDLHMVWSLPNLETEKETPDATHERRYILWVQSRCPRFQGSRENEKNYDPILLHCRFENKRS